MTKKVMFVNQQPPHGSHYAKEQLQMAMVFGAFEQHVSLLFIEDGVYSLIAEQQTDSIGFEDFSKMYKSLEKFYDISDVFVEEQSLMSRGLCIERLLVRAHVVDHQQIELLMREHDFVLSI